jgi:hypothetical protein
MLSLLETFSIPRDFYYFVPPAGFTQSHRFSESSKRCFRLKRSTLRKMTTACFQLAFALCCLQLGGAFSVSKGAGAIGSLTRLQHPVRLPESRLLATTTEKPTELKTEPKKRKQRSTESLEVVVIGLSHHNAKVDVREKLAIPEDNWNIAAASLCEYDGIAEASVLSTCNRFELYLAGANQYEVIRDAMKFLEQRAGGALDQTTLRRNIFMLSGEDAIWHLLRVSAGLDSLIVGEGQILAQVRGNHAIIRFIDKFWDHSLCI